MDGVQRELIVKSLFRARNQIEQLYQDSPPADGAAIFACQIKQKISIKADFPGCPPQRNQSQNKREAKSLRKNRLWTLDYRVKARIALQVEQDISHETTFVPTRKECSSISSRVGNSKPRTNRAGPTHSPPVFCPNTPCQWAGTGTK